MSLSSADEAASAVRVLFLQNCFQLAALVLTFYDHALTLGQEVELIWKKRRSKSKILYLLCRYIGDILVFCDTYIYLNQKPTDMLYVLFFLSFRNRVIKLVDWIQWTVVRLMGMRMTISIAMVSTWITQFILQSRLQALYHSKFVSGFLYALFSGEVLGLSILIVQSLRGIEVTSQPFPGAHQCTLTKAPSWMFMFWVSVLLFDTVLFFLALKLIYTWWSRRLEGPVPQLLFGPSLVFILLRDNFGHCIFAFAVYIVTVIVWLTAEARYASIPSCFSYSITTVMGTRLILNLCDAYHNPSSSSSQGASEWDALSRFTAVNFAPTPNNGRYDTAMTLRIPLDIELNVREEVLAEGSKTIQHDNA